MRARRAPARVIVMTRVAAPTALVLVEDSAGGESAVAVPGQLASATPTSVAVGCAGTDIRLGDLIEVTVPTTATQVRIRANAPVEPTELTIAVARAASGVAR